MHTDRSRCDAQVALDVVRGLAFLHSNEVHYLQHPIFHALPAASRGRQLRGSARDSMLLGASSSSAVSFGLMPCALWLALQVLHSGEPLS